MSAPTIHLYGAKGGVGTSTTAVLLALSAGAACYRATVLADDLRTADDLRAIANVPQGPIQFGPEDGPPLTIVDHGIWAGHRAEEGNAFVVLRRDYLSCRRLVADRPAGAQLILVDEGAALTAADVAAVVGLPIAATVEHSARVARAVDAGILPVMGRAPLLRQLLPPPSAGIHRRWMADG